MGSQALKYEYYYVVLLELLLFPLFYVRDYNFVMRGSIPALFILMIFVIRFLYEKNNTDRNKKRKRLLIIILILGAVTPYTELNRSISKTLTVDNDNFIQNQVYSFGNMQTDDISKVSIVKNQFFVYNYEDTFFFKYLAK